MSKFLVLFVTLFLWESSDSFNSKWSVKIPTTIELGTRFIIRGRVTDRLNELIFLLAHNDDNVALVVKCKFGKNAPDPDKAIEFQWRTDGEWHEGYARPNTWYNEDLEFDFGFEFREDAIVVFAVPTDSSEPPFKFIRKWPHKIPYSDILWFDIQGDLDIVTDFEIISLY